MVYDGGGGGSHCALSLLRFSSYCSVTDDPAEGSGTFSLPFSRPCGWVASGGCGHCGPEDSAPHKPQPPVPGPAPKEPGSILCRLRFLFV